MFALIDQVFVGLVGDYDEVVLLGECRNFFRLLPGEDGAGGILRSVVVDRAGMGGCHLFERRGQAMAASAGCRHEQWPRLGAVDHLANRRPERRKEQHIVAGIEDRLKRNVDRMSSAGGHQYVVDSRRNMVFTA